MTHTPPHYVYMAMLMNYRDANQWYVIRASDAPFTDVKRIRGNVVIGLTAVTRKIEWTIDCGHHAPAVAQAVNDWLRSKGVDRRGGCYLLGYEDVETVLMKAKELAAEQMRLKSYTRIPE
jgi:hypothetical protein